ncbi:hypothetical protein AMTR_s00142p00088550 [Amborella trichopoda]|uniref:PsbP C-terminal domain-containing protein n=1 Tax=Amborella trichopoda TaxID=13333 RepID=W1PEK3_AMBTC|nr:hypothetical protein AMTR_s00142p00088550 [Amborella trichopoda]
MITVADIVEKDDEIAMALQVDDINAYSFLYPVQLPSKKFTFKWVESRKPERYSSAAPLSPDARQRIVSERVDMIDNVVISVSIGPPNSRFLKSKDKNTWNAKDVADALLSDKSSLRITTGQRMAESSVLDAHRTDVDGEPYWYYEYIIRKSPTKSAQDTNLYRQYLASTAERDGYLYSLSASTLSKQWNVGPTETQSGWVQIEVNRDPMAVNGPSLDQTSFVPSIYQAEGAPALSKPAIALARPGAARRS